MGNQQRPILHGPRPSVHLFAPAGMRRSSRRYGQIARVSRIAEQSGGAPVGMIATDAVACGGHDQPQFVHVLQRHGDAFAGSCPRMTPLSKTFRSSAYT